MKKVSLLVVATLLIAGIALLPLPAKADGNGYLAKMTGCTDCGSCKKRVVMAFAKLDGVTTVRFLKKKRGDIHQVVVETDAVLSFNEATSALGDLHHFELKSWKRQAVD